MENKCLKYKILIVLFGILILCILQSKDVNAATASISASNKSVSVGDKVSINVSINAMAWNVKVNGSGVSGSIVGGNMESMSNKSTSKSYTLDTSKVGSYTVSISGDVTDANGDNSNVSDSVTVKVSEKSNTPNNDDTKKEPTFKSSKDTMYATGNINIRKSYSTDSEIIGKLETGDSISRIGIGDNGWSKVSYNGSTGYIKTSLLSEKEPEKSSDKALKTLVITPEGLEPEFNPEVTTYTLNVDENTEKIDIKAAPNDEKAKVEITGNENLQTGDNIIKIVVTAQDATARTYTINVKKQEAVALGLSNLSINGYTLSPKFSTNTYEYKLNILDSKINQIDITAIASDEKATVQISGNTNLKDGDNVVQITVTSQDGKDQATYKITVNKAPMAAGTTKTSNGNIIYVGIVVAILAIFAISVFIMKKKKSKDSKDLEQDDEVDDLYGYTSNRNRAVSQERNNLESSNNVVDHELFGELPGENYISNKAKTYSSIQNEVSNVMQQPTNKSTIMNAENNNTDTNKSIYGNTLYGDFYEDKQPEIKSTLINENQSNNANINDNSIYNNSSYNSFYEGNNVQQSTYKNSVQNEENNNKPQTDSYIYNNTYEKTNNEENYTHMDNSLYGISQNQTVKENTYDNIINNTSSYNSNSSEEDFEDEYTLDDNYKMKRTKGKHSK